MAETWKSVPVSELKPGDTIRLRDHVLVLARIEPTFLGNESMVGLIEDNDQRWHKGVAPADSEVEVLVEG